MKKLTLCTITKITIATVFIATYVHAGPVPDTGQTKCYDNSKEIPCPSPGEPFYGQDANYSINPRSYTIIDGIMVKDNVTGLIWENKSNKDGTKDYTNPHDADNTYTWYDSNPATNGGSAGSEGDENSTKDFLKALNNAGFGGYSDWRLPTVTELRSIIDYNRYDPLIDTEYFKDTVSSFYWSSSTYVNTPDLAWSVDFKEGEGRSDSKYAEYHVRAVRAEDM
ncbi:MAG: DUF1566 domain-containing protein [Desulfamplus sp.]|nr:DUF1566 domain-containing protein [Desulfamplus sp.]